MLSYQPLRVARSAFTPIRLYRYHTLAWGAPDGDAPPLVLLHGWMDVAASWQFMVDSLAPAFLQQRTVIALDWRGFGHTSGPPCDHYVFADYLGDLDALLEHFSPGRPVDLVGHSMGGNVAMMYAGVRPARIHRLVNLEGFGMPVTQAGQAPARLAQWLDELRAQRRGEQVLRTYPDAAAVAARLMKTNPRLSMDKADWLARQWAVPRTGADGGTRWHILGDAAHRVVNPQLSRVEETLALYAAITAPALVVEAQHSELPRWYAGRYTLDEFHQRLRAVPDARRITLADCGHMLHHDQPVPLARQIEQFVSG